MYGFVALIARFCIQDVPHFIKWFHSVRPEPAGTTVAVSDEDDRRATAVAHDAAFNDALDAAGGGIGEAHELVGGGGLPSV